MITVYPGHAVPAYSLGEWFACGRWWQYFATNPMIGTALRAASATALVFLAGFFGRETFLPGGDGCV